MPAHACDLVLLSWNQLECTRPCVESILANTGLPCRLIIVDQNSDAETRAYLRGLRSTPRVTVELLFNPTNVGYPAGMNLGLRRAAAPYVCFLNNDILVPPGWLEELIRVAESGPSVGLVNPSSNTFGILPPAGTGWKELARRCGGHRGEWIEVRYGEGFCLLGRRDLLLTVGGFDETTYEQIYFEDADLGRKIQAQGFRCVMALGTYVWHEGGQTMATRPDRLRLFQENERRFHQRWPRGKRVLIALKNGSRHLAEAAGEEARSEANRSGEVWIVAQPALRADLPRHLSIRILSCPAWQIPGRALLKAITKKKKFDRIVTDSAALRLALKGTAFLHRAAVEPIRSTQSTGRSPYGDPPEWPT